MVALNTDYAPSKISTRSQNRVGDFFVKQGSASGRIDSQAAQALRRKRLAATKPRRVALIGHRGIRLGERGGFNVYSFVRNDGINFINPFGKIRRQYHFNEYKTRTVIVDVYKTDVRCECDSCDENCAYQDRGTPTLVDGKVTTLEKRWHRQESYYELWESAIGYQAWLLIKSIADRNPTVAVPPEPALMLAADPYNVVPEYLSSNKSTDPFAGISGIAVPKPCNKDNKGWADVRYYTEEVSDKMTGWEGENRSDF